jgi:hypothetical protein
MIVTTRSVKGGVTTRSVGTIIGSRPDEPLLPKAWEILWLEQRLLCPFSDVLFLIFHQGECNAGQLAGQD